MKKRVCFFIIGISILQITLGQVSQLKDSIAENKIYHSFIEVISCYMDTAQLSYFKELKKINLTKVEYGFAKPSYQEKLFNNLLENYSFKAYLKMSFSDSTLINCTSTRNWKLRFYTDFNSNSKPKCSILFYPVAKANNQYYAYASMTSRGYFDDMYGVDYVAVFNSQMDVIHLSPLIVFY